MQVRRNSKAAEPPSEATPAAHALRLVAEGDSQSARRGLPPHEALTRSELEAFISGTSDVVLVLDGQGVHLRVMSSREDLLLCPASSMVGRRLQDIMPASTASRLLEVVGRALDTGITQEVQYELEVDGHLVCLEATATPTNENTVLWVARDVTQRRAAQLALRQREREVLGIFESAFDGMLVCAPDLRCLQVNAQLCELLGNTREELLSRRYSDLINEEDLRLRPLRLTELYASGRIVTERRLRRADGATLEAEVGTTMLEDGRILLVVRDITARKQAEATIRSLALTDELTGLYNRRGFLALAERERDRALRQQRGALFFIFDLDDLKPINDEHGHMAGDAALMTVAGVLRATFRGSDVVGRLGGDEFAAFVVPGGGATNRDSDAISRLVDTEPIIRTRVAQHLFVANAEATAAGQPFTVSLSMGVSRLAASIEGSAPSLASLLAEADALLYDEKRSRKQEPPC